MLDKNWYTIFNIMNILFWTGILILCLYALVKSADYFTNYSEKLGLAFGLSSFVIGATIVAIGTSLPELVSSLFAVIDAGNTEFVADNIIGSNIANALLILGIGAGVAKTLKVQTSLIDVDLPFFFTSMALFVFFAMDSTISLGEGLLLLALFVIFLIYSAKSGDTAEEIEMDKDEMEDLSEQFAGKKTGKTATAKSGAAKKKTAKSKKKKSKKTATTEPVMKYVLFILLSAALVTLSAKYLITSIITLSTLLGISSSLLTITVVAIGTSLPEVMTSISAIKLGNHGIAIGNVFGSNTFNLLLVGGIPTLFSELSIGSMAMTVGIPFLVIATLVAIFTTFDNKIRIWEGAAMLLLYGVFLLRIINVI